MLVINSCHSRPSRVSEQEEEAMGYIGLTPPPFPSQNKIKIDPHVGSRQSAGFIRDYTQASRDVCTSVVKLLLLHLTQVGFQPNL